MIQVVRPASLDPEVQQQIEKMEREGWLDETSDLHCIVCDARLQGEAHWYLALDTENPIGCASGYVCFNAICIRKAPAILRRTPRKHY